MTKIKILKPAPEQNQGQDKKPSRAEAEDAIRTLLRYTGEDISRPGLIDTPARVIRSYDEFFAGYDQNPADVLNRTFEDIEGYKDFVLVKNIDFISHCEHHMVPIVGTAHVAYWPDEHVVGISKLARTVDIYSKRLISQEVMTRNIVEAIDSVLAPKGTAVLIDAVHHCMSIRGANKPNSSTVTSMFSGIFEHNDDIRRRFLDLCR